MEIELSNPEGNAFAIMHLATKLCAQLDIDDLERDALLKDMKSSDYANLVKVFWLKFNSVVNIYSNGEPYRPVNI
jgi:hypothetical protein